MVLLSNERYRKSTYVPIELAEAIIRSLSVRASPLVRRNSGPKEAVLTKKVSTGGLQV